MFCLHVVKCHAFYGPYICIFLGSLSLLLKYRHITVSFSFRFVLGIFNLRYIYVYLCKVVLVYSEGDTVRVIVGACTYGELACPVDR